MRKKIVFDLDDVLYPLNSVICEKEGINIEKITRFNLVESMLSEEEVRRMMECYKDPSIYRSIAWFPAVARLPEITAAGGDIYINSNSFNQEVIDAKSKRLEELVIPKDRIQLNCIGHPDSKKTIGDDVFAFVDDSLHNQKNSMAQHKILINYPWNVYGRESVKCIGMPSLDAAIDHILRLLSDCQQNT